MIRLGMMALAWLLAVTPAHAEPKTPATLAKTSIPSAALKLVEMLDTERLLDTMFGGLKDLFANNVIAELERDPSQTYLKSLFENGRGGREKFAALLGEELLKALQSRYPEMKQAAATEYARAFTVEELEELNAFFATGAGAKWRATAPQVEAAMGKWGERAGMEAGTMAVMNALKRADVEMLGQGGSR